MSFCSSPSGIGVTNKKSRKIYPFQEARRLARGHGFATKEEFIEYECAGAYQLPKNADEVWKDDGWNGWDDFLGIPYRAYEEAKVVVCDVLSGKGVRTEEEYLRFMEQRSKKSNLDNNEDSEEQDARIARLPYRPDLYYKNEWLSWEDYLGKL